MADFCNQCSKDMGFEGGDLVNLSSFNLVNTICEGCGPYCIVDTAGDCVSADCLKKHGPIHIDPSL